jgi:hypothetical protein
MPNRFILKIRFDEVVLVESIFTNFDVEVAMTSKGQK